MAQMIVFDSWALMAYFEDEPAAEKVTDLITNAQVDRTAMLMSVVNVGEVWYALARKYSTRDADEAVSDLRAIGIIFSEVDWELTSLAAEYKSRGGISYADCFAAALAKQKKGQLVTGDREFKQLE